MTLTIPESHTSEGNIRATFVPTLASTSAPSAATLNGATAVNLSSFLMPGWGGIQSEQNTGQDRRFGSKEGFNRLGRITRSLGQLVYTWLPQAISTDAGNKAYTGLAAGTTGFVVFGFDKSPATAWAASDKAWVVPVECGVQNPDSAASDEFAPLTITQTLGVTGTIVTNAVLAA